jgi:hypothetical protein
LSLDEFMWQDDSDDGTTNEEMDFSLVIDKKSFF